MFCCFSCKSQVFVVATYRMSSSAVERLLANNSAVEIRRLKYSLTRVTHLVFVSLAVLGFSCAIIEILMAEAMGSGIFAQGRFRQLYLLTSCGLLLLMIAELVSAVRWNDCHPVVNARIFGISQVNPERQ